MNEIHQVEFDFPMTPDEVTAEKKRRAEYLIEQNERNAERAQAKEDGDVRRAFEERPKRGENHNDLLGG